MYNAPRQSGGGGLRLPQLGGMGGSATARWILLGVAALLVLCLCGSFTLLGGLFTSGGAATPVPANPPTSGIGFGPGGNGDAGLQLGPVVTAAGIGPGNQPTNPTTTFAANSPTIYAVIEVRNVTQGGSFFARWLRDGQQIEDSAQLIADRAYPHTFVEFHLQPPSGTTFQPGTYTVQIYSNGNRGPTTQFVVR